MQLWMNEKYAKLCILMPIPAESEIFDEKSRFRLFWNMMLMIFSTVVIIMQQKIF